MTLSKKQISNPFSTGGGGGRFEARVQSLFVVLMLSGGFAPGLPPWPITKIKLQGKHADYETDDFIVFATEPASKRECKLLAQIKHSVAVTEKDAVFGEVLHAAWCDFQNAKLFTRGVDQIALITGPLSSMDIEHTCRALEIAKSSENAKDFLTKIDLGNFCSDTQRKKMRAFRAKLDQANGGPVADEDFWHFLKGFHLLGFDLDGRAGVTLSLIQSLIAQYSNTGASDIWPRIVEEVQTANQNAGTLTKDLMPTEILQAFERKVQHVVPADLGKATPRLVTAPTVAIVTNTLSQNLVVSTASLVGAWTEKSAGDTEVIEQLSKSANEIWLKSLQELLLAGSAGIRLSNGKWNVDDRKQFWVDSGNKIFDDQLDRFKIVAIAVFKERDPSFDLESNERHAASLYGKVFSHSRAIREGLADGVALLGASPQVLSNCSVGKAEFVAWEIVRATLIDAEWWQWASLANLLPSLAEGAPSEFLNAVEAALVHDPCPFDRVFREEGDGFMGRTYMSGLLWALEGLAWDEEYLSRVAICLGGLADRDPGGTWANRPANSLTSILLPWHPQTRAPLAKQIKVVQALLSEYPEVGWKLLMSLLPESRSTTSGTRKPVWRMTTIPDVHERITHAQYWEQVEKYAELAVAASRKDTKKLYDLAAQIATLPPTAREAFLADLENGPTATLAEIERVGIWSKLLDVVAHHRRYSTAAWAMPSDEVNRIDAIAAKLAPKNAAIRYQRLFTNRDFDLFEGADTDYQKQRADLTARRKEAVRAIAIAGNGPESVVRFAESATSPWQVGFAYGEVADRGADRQLLPKYLLTEPRTTHQFISAYVMGRFVAAGWAWVDELKLSKWSATQAGLFLASLPFTPEAWSRGKTILKAKQAEYWTITSANPYDYSGDFSIAVDSLLQYSRPYAALGCLRKSVRDGQQLDVVRTIKVLDAVASAEDVQQASRPDDAIDMIKMLQDDPQTNADDLFRIEWRYLPVLDEHHDAAPKLLAGRLASDPGFYSEVIRLVFRSKKQDDETHDPTEGERKIATNAYRLLTHWRRPPGSREDGSIDSAALESWVTRMKQDCKESGHFEIGMSMVGHVLKYAPPDPDGLWIHRATASVLNAKDAANMRDGFRTEFFNSRGVHGFSGGENEKALAERYRGLANSVEEAGFVRVATTMRELAAQYDADAKREAASRPFEN